ncbi:OmpW family outer membrane protein [Aquabacterium sp. CECT 9606]|uniref:OmpW family outer membrane protein n=1 Tax=Aquabacterium sp. CECT 9606 TaxID=2845822 RepID=UPI001E45D8E4|nr:OmpW family outer membrane protein [Aquabacterium sp. CECT 9606]CAH0348575.1 hypothetical protein AQB9606_00631 [Aquabacterium sp. CECT 9606]
MTMPFRLSAVAGLIFLGAMASAGAETTTDRYGKELKIEPSRNIFARFGVLGFKMNNKSEAARDVSGPVLSRPAVIGASGLPQVLTPGDRGWVCTGGIAACDNSNGDVSTIYGTATEGTLFNGTGVDVLGLPDNVKANVSDPKPGMVGTVGMYFDEEHKWAIEVPVMALPFEADIYGAGTFQNAGKIISAKTLGFFVFGHYYFGQKADKFRPSVSLSANYLLPYDMHATSELERWTGGRTKVSSKGSLGLGWLVGGKYAINDRWDLNFNFGQFKAKLETTLVTYDTNFTWNSPIFTYWPGQLGENIRSLQFGGAGSILNTQLVGMKAYRNSDPANRVNGGANLGTFTRKQTQTLDPYVMMVSVGYNF